MRIIGNKYTVFLYLALMFAAFNDIIRVGTGITAFRIIQPLILLLAILQSNKSRKLLTVYFILIILNICQTLIFSKHNSIGITFDLSSFINYAYYYLCIVTVICAVIMIYESNPDSFICDFKKFIMGLGWIDLMILLLHSFLRSFGFLTVANINNYGASIAAIYPVFFIAFFTERTIHNLGFIILSIIALLLGDCKLSLIGIAISSMVVFYELSKKGKTNKKHYGRIIFPILILVILALIFYFVTKTDYGNNLLLQIQISFDSIYNRRFLSTASSLGYRINVIIVSIQWLFNTYFLGIGIGNYGILIRHECPYLPIKWIELGTVAPHNSPIEFLIEFGFPVLILYFLLIKRVLLLKKEPKTENSVLYIAEFVSVWVWSLNPSRILTIYLIWIVLTYTILATKDKV